MVLYCRENKIIYKNIKKKNYVLNFQSRKYNTALVICCILYNSNFVCSEGQGNLVKFIQCLFLNLSRRVRERPNDVKSTKKHRVVKLQVVDVCSSNKNILLSK